MKFIYNKEISEVSKNGMDCPPAQASAVDRTAWRWVFNPMKKECFQPQGIRNPRRLHREKDLEVKCSCWAVSMHDSYEKSVIAFKRLESSFSRIRKVIGDHVARGEVEASDGLCTPVNGEGHFIFTRS